MKPDRLGRRFVSGTVAEPAIARRAAMLPGEALGFVEVSLRVDCVNGTSTSPVGFLEGTFVVPAARRQGIAKALVAEAEGWARRHGALEFASDALLENGASHALHRALGFDESERVVFFRKRIAENGA